MRCLQYGAIIDFENKSYEQIDVPVGIKKQFNVINKRVILEGHCKKCQKSKSLE